MNPVSVQVITGGSGGHRWELAAAAVPADLRPYVRNWSGYVEESPGSLVRREFPGIQVVVILEFGPPICVYDYGSPHSTRYRGGFVAGLHDAYTLTKHDGEQRGIQLNLTPHGARRFFNIPLNEISGRIIAWPDLFPNGAAVVERIANAPTWEHRFAILEDLVRRRVRAPLGNDRSGTKTRQLTKISLAAASLGSAYETPDLRQLAAQLGYSHKHMIALFREHAGLPPRLYARIARFDRLAARLKRSDETSWADLALACGYYDQAHLIRDVRTFTGYTPTELRATFVEIAAASD